MNSLWRQPISFGQPAEEQPKAGFGRLQQVGRLKPEMKEDAFGAIAGNDEEEAGGIGKVIGTIASIFA